jgi:hypothetical protein
MNGSIADTDISGSTEPPAEELLPESPSVTALTAALVEQAKGVLVFRYGIDSFRALTQLGRWADEAGTTVEDVAHALVFAICQGVEVGPSDTRLARWIEERLRHELDAGA